MDAQQQMSLSQHKKAAGSLPVKGSHAMTIPQGDQGEGRYVVRAAYQDKGSQGIPSIMAEKKLVLRSARIPAGKADKTESVMKYGILIIASLNGSGIGFSNIDLTNIAQGPFGGQDTGPGTQSLCR